MGLTNENRNAASDQDRQIAFAVANGQARALARALVLFEHNPDPHPERNLENPAHSVSRIRTFRPMIPFDYRVEVSRECRDHNTAVSELRKP
jgi:hypothetical protein